MGHPVQVNNQIQEKISHVLCRAKPNRKSILQVKIQG
jgi:hypothetical protein